MWDTCDFNTHCMRPSAPELLPPAGIAVAYHRGVLRPGSPGTAEEAQSVVVCGFVACDMKPFNPLINALPRLLHLRAGELGPWTV